jgi:argininosuccinate synthase
LQLSAAAINSEARALNLEQSQSGKEVMNGSIIASYEAKPGEVAKALLLFSGGLDSSIMLKWIKEHYGCGVVALTVDLGQFTSAAQREQVREKALRLGASDAVVYDARQEFVSEYVAKSILSNGRYRGKYYLSTPLGRPLIAKVAAKIAPEYGCTAVAHGCTGKGNDQVRLDAGIIALDPGLKIIAPVRVWDLGRTEEMAYAQQHGIEVPVTAESPYSHDTNLWGNTSEGAEIEHPEKCPRFEKALGWCTPPEKAPDKGETVTVGFEQGLPVSLNGETLPLMDLIGRLNTIGGRHGIGIGIVIEDRILGMKSRGVYEAPAAEILTAAHGELEKTVLTFEQLQMKSIIDRQWSLMCYHAKWFDPLMKDLNSYIRSASRDVAGAVEIKLYKGTASVTAVYSPYSLFNDAASSFNAAGLGFNVAAAAPFIEHYSAWQWQHRRVRLEEITNETYMAEAWAD